MSIFHPVQTVYVVKNILQPVNYKTTVNKYRNWNEIPSTSRVGGNEQ